MSGRGYGRADSELRWSARLGRHFSGCERWDRTESRFSPGDAVGREMRCCGERKVERVGGGDDGSSKGEKWRQSWLQRGGATEAVTVTAGCHDG